jgi:hypothetical protein
MAVMSPVCVGIEWATRRFGSLADAGAKRLGVDINEEASK